MTILSQIISAIDCEEHVINTMHCVTSADYTKGLGLFTVGKLSDLELTLLITMGKK